MHYREGTIENALFRTYIEDTHYKSTKEKVLGCPIKGALLRTNIVEEELFMTHIENALLRTHI